MGTHQKRNPKRSAYPPPPQTNQTKIKHNVNQELAAQLRGIDHPEVADLAAVSAAVARLRDSTGSAGPHLRCVEAAAKYLGNALQNPTMGKVGPPYKFNRIDLDILQQHGRFCVFHVTRSMSTPVSSVSTKLFLFSTDETIDRLKPAVPRKYCKASLLA